MDDNVLIYGAYGYTGRLIVEQLLARDIKPVIAGRKADRIEKVAEKYGLDFHVFDLSDPKALHDFLSAGRLVIHCAGPFIHTCEIMAKACVQTRTHYLDITGEYQVFDLLQTFDDQAREKGIMILPGAGFDVVPSDCLANYLKEKMPAARALEMAFVSKSTSISRGTIKTMIENLGHKQMYRKEGKYEGAKIGAITRSVPFGPFERICTLISWGDISSAYFSTGIPNIKVYMGVTEKSLKKMRRMARFGWLIRQSWVKKYFLRQVDKRKHDGPKAEKRASSPTYLWAEAHDENNQVVTARMKVPNGYSLTADATATIVQKMISGDLKPGFQTPATAYGWQLLKDLKDVQLLSE